MRFRASRFAPLLILAGTLAYTDMADATVWQTGDETTYDQATWGDVPNPSNIAGLLQDNYDTVYAATAGVFEVGISGASGFSIEFTDSASLLAYLPAGGSAGSLTADLIDPTSTSSGILGGDISALKLNIDFADAGLTLGSSGIPFGNLVLVDFATLPNLDGLTVREFFNDANVCLGGGACIDDVSDIDGVVANLNASFGGGAVTDFAQLHLAAPNTVSVPEPSSLLLFASGLVGVAVRSNRKRRNGGKS